jgi:hypothetical protein
MGDVYWYDNPNYSNLWIMDNETNEKFPVHALILYKNKFFRQVLDSIKNGSSMFSKDENGIHIIPVINIRIAKIFIKAIYVQELFKSQFAIIDLTNTSDIISLLEYSNMWLFHKKIFNLCVTFVSEHLNVIIGSNLDIIPILTPFFDQELAGRILYNRFILAVESILKKNKDDLTVDILKWPIMNSIDGTTILHLMEMLVDPEDIYTYCKKFLNNTTIYNTILGHVISLSIEKIGLFYDQLDGVVDNQIIIDLYQKIRSYKKDKSFFEKFGLKNFSIMCGIYYVSKTYTDHVQRRSLILKKINPFEVTLSLLLCSNVLLPLDGKGISFIPSDQLSVGEKIYLKNKTEYEIIKIIYNGKETNIAYSNIRHQFILKDFNQKCISNINDCCFYKHINDKIEYYTII